MNDKEHRNLERAGKADTDRILTIPNVLSFFRLALIPVIIVLYAKNEVWWAFGMLVLSGVTDVVDGWVARTYHMVSNFGKAIDPVADKLTQIAVLLCLMPMKCWWVVGILVLKEVSIGIMTLLTLHHTGMVYGAGWYGKLCTAVIYLSMFVLMLWRTAPDWFLYADAALCACLILLAFVKYAIRYGGILREARGSRHECADPLVFCGTCPAAGAAPRPQEALLPLPGLQSRADRPGRLRPDEDRLPQVRGDLLTENLNNDGPPRNTLRKEGAPGRFFCKRAFRQFSKQTIQFPALR